MWPFTKNPKQEWQVVARWPVYIKIGQAAAAVVKYRKGSQVKFVLHKATAQIELDHEYVRVVLGLTDGEMN